MGVQGVLLLGGAAACFKISFLSEGFVHDARLLPLDNFLCWIVAMTG